MTVDCWAYWKGARKVSKKVGTTDKKLAGWDDGLDDGCVEGIEFYVQFKSSSSSW